MNVYYNKIKVHQSVSTYYGEERTIGAGDEMSSSGKGNYKSVMLETDTGIVYIVDKEDRVIHTTLFNLACGYPMAFFAEVPEARLLEKQAVAAHNKLKKAESAAVVRVQKSKKK